MSAVTTTEDAERELAELRALHARAQAAREDDATRIARELHDGLGQTLTALTLDIGWLRERVAEDVRLHLDEMADLVKGALASTRRLAGALRPTVLEDLGLGAGLEGLVEEWSSRTDIACRTDLRAEGLVFGRRTSIAIFRVLEEALSNVAHHAAATSVTISFAHDREAATLIVSDDGCGFSMIEARAKGALGLRAMRERMAALGGALDVTSAPGQGTRIVARVPVDEPA